MTSGKCIAVMYHYVRNRDGTPDADIQGLNVVDFQAQLDVLCELLTPIDWPTLLAWRVGRRPMPEDSVLFTFDDGLADHADVVCPILEARGLRGVFLVSTALLVDSSMPAAHQIHLLMCRLGLSTLTEAVVNWLDTEEPDWHQHFGVNLGEAWRMYHYETSQCAELKYLLTNALPIDLRNRLIGDLFIGHVGDPSDYARRWYSQTDQLVDMQNAGHTIGGHGHLHEPYARLSACQQVADMSRCWEVLAERLGSRQRPFSYPYGSYSNDIAHRCAFSGFVNGFTTQQGWVRPSDDAHRLCRVDTIHVDAFLEREFACISH